MLSRSFGVYSLELRHLISMLWVTLLLAAISSTALSAQRKRSSATESGFVSPYYLIDICERNDTWSEPTRPCETMEVIEYQCVSGLEYNEKVDLANQTFPDCVGLETCQSFEFERTCFCQSQYLDSATGCYACYREHGGDRPSWTRISGLKALQSLMSSYCDPTLDPTAAFGDYLLGMTYEPPYGPRSSDPLGFKRTDVSLYYTSSLTGVEAWTTELSKIDGWSEDAILPSSDRSSTSSSATSTSAASDSVSSTSKSTSTSGSTNGSTSISTRDSTSTVSSTSAAHDTTSASTSFSSTTYTPVNPSTPTIYSTVYTRATPTSATSTSMIGSASFVTSASTSHNALDSIAGIVKILSFAAVVGSCRHAT